MQIGKWKASGPTLRPLISLAALHIRGKFPCMIRKAASVQLIWLLVACRSASIAEFEAARTYQYQTTHCRKTCDKRFWMLEANADTIVANDTMHRVVVYRYNVRLVTECFA